MQHLLRSFLLLHLYRYVRSICQHSTDVISTGMTYRTVNCNTQCLYVLIACAFCQLCTIDIRSWCYLENRRQLSSVQLIHLSLLHKTSTFSCLYIPCFYIRVFAVHKKTLHYLVSGEQLMWGHKHGKIAMTAQWTGASYVYM